MWFKRDWQLIDKTILPSGYQQMEASAKNIKMDDMSRYFQQTLVLTFKCSLTNKVKTVVVRSQK